MIDMVAIWLTQVAKSAQRFGENGVRKDKGLKPLETSAPGNALRNSA